MIVQNADPAGAELHTRVPRQGAGEFAQHPSLFPECSDDPDCATGATICTSSIMHLSTNRRSGEGEGGLPAGEALLRLCVRSAGFNIDSFKMTL